MQLPTKAERVRIFTGEGDRVKGRPLYEIIVEEARSRGLAGATVLRGVCGFGANSRVKTSKILMLSQDLPLVIEIVDASDRIRDFLPYLEETVREGLITLEPVDVLAYRHKNGEKPA